VSEQLTAFPEHNPDDPTRDLWYQPRADLQGDRPPGLIDLSRYLVGVQAHGATRVSATTS